MDAAKSPERRRDNWKTAIMALVCALSGAGGSIGGLKVGVVVLETKQAVQEKRIDGLEKAFTTLAQNAVTLDENLRADAAQDRRIDDQNRQLEAIHSDIRMLIQMEQARGNR